VRDLGDWQRLLDERFSRRGAYVVQAGDFDWTAVDDKSSYVPALEPGHWRRCLASRGRALRPDAAYGRSPAWHLVGRRTGKPAPSDG